MRRDIGSRVGAILSASREEVRLLGYGVYLGNLLRPGWEDLARSYLPVVREINEEQAAKSLESIVEQTEALERWIADQESRPVRSSSEIRAKAQLIYDRNQQALQASDDELIEQMKSTSMLTNPCIQLDDGRIVWGFQCWWGNEERVKEEIGGRRLVIVDLDGRPLQASV